MATQSDLTTGDGVIEYLKNTQFEASLVEALDGGNANYTWRIHLKNQHRGHSSLVFKHAEAHVAKYPSIPFPTGRFVWNSSVDFQSLTESDHILIDLRASSSRRSPQSRISSRPGP